MFLLGLDKLYRDAMMVFESTRLLACARSVAGTLGVQPPDIPVEGYYCESSELSEYFRLVSALRDTGEDRETVVKSVPEFQLLWDVMSSPLYGRPQRRRKLLPVGRDALSQAMLDTRPDWGIEGLTKAAYEAALRADRTGLNWP